MDDPDTGSHDRELQLLSRDELEQQVRQRTSELENVMDAMADVLITLDDQGTVTMINEAVDEILGYESADLEGKPIDVLLTDPPAESQSPISSTSQLVERLLGDGQVTDMEIYCSSADGETVPMSLSASMLKDDDGVPSGIVCVAKDIRERKAAEQRAEFLYSLLHHDLGNSLQVADGFVTLLADTELDETQRSHVDRTQNALETATELISDVRTLKQADRAALSKPVSLKPTLTDVLDRYEPLREELGITVDTDLDEVSVIGDELLTEVFTNLVENALTHSNADRLRVGTTVETDTVTVTIEDDGDGIPPEVRDTIFDRGYTTGGSGNSGLGMYIVGELVENYDGDITVSESSLGGARFNVTLARVTDTDRNG